MNVRAHTKICVVLLFCIACSDDTSVSPQPVDKHDILSAPTEIAIGTQTANVVPLYRLGPLGQPLLVMPEVQVKNPQNDGAEFAVVEAIWVIVDEKLTTISHPHPGQDALLFSEGSQQRLRRYFENMQVVYNAGASVVFGARVVLGGFQGLVRSEEVHLADPTPPTIGQTLFDNFGGNYETPDPVGDSGGFLVSGPRFIFSWTDEASSFSLSATETASFTLSTIQLPLFRNDFADLHPGSVLTVSVYSDIGGNPGVELESVLVTMSSPDPELLSVSFSGVTVIAPGQTYWVVLKGVDDSSHVWLRPKTAPETGSRKSRVDYFWAGFSNIPAFAVTGNPVVTAQ